MGSEICITDGVWIASQRLDKATVLETSLLSQRRLDVLREFVAPLTVDQEDQGFEVNQPVQAGRPLTRRDMGEKAGGKEGTLADGGATGGG